MIFSKKKCFHENSGFFIRLLLCVAKRRLRVSRCLICLCRNKNLFLDNIFNPLSKFFRCEKTFWFCLKLTLMFFLASVQGVSII